VQLAESGVDPHDMFCFSSELGSDLINVPAHVKWVSPVPQNGAS
jgi:hypothetical protein